MKPCEHLSQYLDGRLERAGKDYFESHLDACPDCRSVLDMWVSTKGILKKEAAERWRVLTPTMAEADRLVERVRLERTGRDPWNLRTLFPVAVTASVTFALAWVLFGNVEEEYATELAEDAVETTGAGDLQSINNKMAGDSPVLGDSAADDGAIANRAIGYKTSEAGRTVGTLGNDRFGLGPASQLNVVSVDAYTTRLNLKNGFAVFSVAPRTGGRKFIVEAGDIQVRVIGTRFSVNRSDDDVRVVVVEGKVEVADDNGRVWRITKGEALSVKDVGVVELSETSETESVDMARMLGERIPDDMAVLTRAPEDVNNEAEEDAAMVFEVAEAIAPGAAPRQGLVPQKAQKASALEDPKIFVPGAASSGHVETDDVEGNAATDAPDQEEASVAVQGIDQWRNWVLEGKLKEAEAALRGYLKRHPIDTDAHSLLADCLRKAGKYPEAVETYKYLIAVAGAGQANRARFKAGVLLQEQMRDHFGAATIFEDYLATGKGSPLLTAKAMVRLARSLIALKEKTRAKALLQRVVTDHSGTSAAINAREILEQINP